MATHVAGLMRALDNLMQTDGNPTNVIQQSESLWKCRVLSTGALFRDASGDVVLVCEAGPWDMKVINLEQTPNGDYKINPSSRCYHICVTDCANKQATMSQPVVDTGDGNANCIRLKTATDFVSLHRFAFMHYRGQLTMATISSLCKDVLGQDGGAQSHVSLSEKVKEAMQALGFDEAQITEFLTHIKESSKQQKRKRTREDQDEGHEDTWDDPDVYDRLLAEDQMMEEEGDELSAMLEEVMEEEFEESNPEPKSPIRPPAETKAESVPSGSSSSSFNRVVEVPERMEWRLAMSAASDLAIPSGCRLDLKRKTNQQPFWQATLPPRMKFEGTNSKSYSFCPEGLASASSSSRCSTRSEAVAKRLAAQWLWNWDAAKKSEL